MSAIKQQIVGFVDFTTLNDTDTTESVREFCKRAVTPLGNVAAVCVYPQFVSVAKETIPATIGLATVVNFPSGAEEDEAIFAETRQALKDGANEIDLVFPYGRFQKGDTQYAHELTEKVGNICHEAGAKMKVILETGALSAEETHAAAKIAIAAGADFLKTSTGKIKVGATPEAAAILLAEIKASGKPVGIKLSGGVRELAAAQGYVQQAVDVMGADWLKAENFRIGASGLLEALLK
ncbi:deoxyribose-phosphate aldolase [Kingella negevensis]|uniref:Deoxyribose-phosphate aldolase n=1 Tax=Kingella negevensis TaxID=1522312 RepID=A0A238TDR2_9NEIS|nr:deoxyribose-phosphate aldolase [Kingella negevensis]MDK4684988.1 deoxyribose-phosphate aldolase [Kingella negevensis]MDK4689234.1 deoxyribose-phosphate aldolase [Kingella negevensis]MDK4697894.1 deoxyribose-phosphate aldolase [Kingella negevensis]MDK4708592.1 deoxyribose-phosphate aldolase [Kingella negevensis]MDK4710363.1 deoxyribose-phosphate aldolase [Kingella negevensis]